MCLNTRCVKPKINVINALNANEYHETPDHDTDAPCTVPSCVFVGMVTKLVTINDACPIILLHMHHIMIGIQTYLNSL